MIKKNGIVILIMCIMALGFGAGNGYCLEKVTVADAPTTHHTALYLGMDKGIFEKHGIEINYVKVKGLGSARDAVSAGGADVLFACPTFTMVAIDKGSNIKIMSQAKVPCTSICVLPKGSSIGSVSDLDGKKVAGINTTCEAVIAFSKAVKDEGGDMNIVKLGPKQAMASLEAGVVDAAILEEPFASVMELKGYDLKFRDVVDVPCRMISGNANFISDRPEVAKNFVAAIKEASEIFMADPTSEEIIDIAYKYTKSDITAIKHGNPRINLTTQLDLEKIDSLNNFLVDLGAISALIEEEKLFAKEFQGITW